MQWYSYILAKRGAKGRLASVLPNEVICSESSSAPRYRKSYYQTITSVNFSKTSLTFRASESAVGSGGVGKGNEVIFSILMLFICKTTPTQDVTQVTVAVFLYLQWVCD